VGAGCRSPVETPPDRLTILTHESFAAGDPDGEAFISFTAATGINVELIPAGDAGSMVNQAILTKDNPLADVLFGVDDTFLSRALDADLFVPYTSGLIESVSAGLLLDPSGRVTPIDFGDVCINYDKAVELPAGLPSGLADLAEAPYRDLLVVENPATSSTGLAFLLATIATFGDDGWRSYWQRLVDNGVKVTSDWDTAYYSEFTRYGGDRPLVVSYASSPPAEVIFSDPRPQEAPTGVLTEGCYRQVEFAGILAGTQHQALAGRLIDYMLDKEFQQRVPLTWFVFPANQEVALPPEFVEHTSLPAHPLTMDPAVIDANRERWIEEWTQIVLP
jgi:thiamine transport system substrate-binding protein